MAEYGHDLMVTSDAVRGQSYVMYIEWDGFDLIWTVDGVEVARGSSSHGFGAEHTWPRLCYAAGGDAQGWKGTLKNLVLPLGNDEKNRPKCQAIVDIKHFIMTL